MLWSDLPWGQGMLFSIGTLGELGELGELDEKVNRVNYQCSLSSNSYCTIIKHIEEGDVTDVRVV
jgi:hypothetical protein